MISVILNHLDVRKILPEGLLSDPIATGIARSYNNKGKIVNSPNGGKVVICAAGEVDQTHYRDSKTGSVFSFDHLTLAASEELASPTIEELFEPKRAALQAALNDYISKKYQSEDSAAGVFVKDSKLAVLLVGEKQNLRNFWSGKWTSSWTIELVDGAMAKLSGEVKVS